MREATRTRANPRTTVIGVALGGWIASAFAPIPTAASPADYTFVQIASENDPGFVAQGFRDLAINDLGQVAYTRAPDVQSPTFAHGGAVLLGDGVQTSTLVDGTTSVPPDSFFVTFLNLGDPGSASFRNVDVNSSGQVVFEAQLNDRANPYRLGDTGTGLFATDLAGNLIGIGIADNDCCGPEPEFAELGRAAINDRGVVAFAAREQTPGDPLFFEPAMVVTRSTADPTGSTAVALREYNDSYFDPDLGRQVGTQIRLDLFAALDDAGTVVTTGYYTFVPPVGDIVQGSAVLAGPAEPAMTAVIGDGVVNPFNVVSGQPAIADTGLVTFLATPSGMGTSLFGVDLPSDPPAAIVPAASPIDQVELHDSNDAGEVVVSVFLDGFTGSGVFTGPDLELDRVLATGDTVFGRTVQGARAGRINDRGQVALLVTFEDDGSQAILRADPVGAIDPGPCTPSLPGPLDEAACLPELAAELATGSPVTMSRPLTLDGDETAVAFALRFLTSSGDSR